MSSEPIELPIVVKVGGSLFDWPELKPRLQQFLAALGEGLERDSVGAFCPCSADVSLAGAWAEWVVCEGQALATPAVRRAAIPNRAAVTGFAP